MSHSAKQIVLGVPKGCGNSVVEAPGAQDSGKSDKAVPVVQRVAGARQGASPPRDVAYLEVTRAHTPWPGARTSRPTVVRGGLQGRGAAPASGWEASSLTPRPQCPAFSPPKSTKDGDCQELREMFLKTRMSAGSIKGFFSC